MVVSFTVPAPVGGWNARDPLDLMDPSDAVSLDNYVPGARDVSLRAGMSAHSTGMGSGAIKTLASYSGMDGTEKLIVGTNSKFYDATSDPGSDITGATVPTNDKWEHVLFSNTLIFVNGTDQPQKYTGSGNVSDTLFTHASYNDANTSHISAYRESLYLTEKNSANIYYAAAGAVAGAVTLLPVLSLLKKGGYVLWTAGYSRDAGDGLEDLFVICSNKGEILIFSGDDPGDPNWVIKARIELPKPLGLRSKVALATDLLVLTIRGAIPLSQAISSSLLASQGVVTFTDKIQNAFRTQAKNTKNLFGWEAILYPEGDWMVINVPIVEDAEFHQYCMNTSTGAWFRVTGWNACTFALYEDGLYFGGLDGKVYHADNDTSDDGDYINAYGATAYNFNEDRQSEKRYVGVRHIMRLDTEFALGFGVNTDFNEEGLDAVTSVTGESGAAWDTGTWDIDTWGGSDEYRKDFESVSGIGRCCSIKFGGQVKNLNYAISSFQVYYEPGGPL